MLQLCDLSGKAALTSDQLIEKRFNKVICHADMNSIMPFATESNNKCKQIMKVNEKRQLLYKNHIS